MTAIMMMIMVTRIAGYENSIFGLMNPMAETLFVSILKKYRKANKNRRLLNVLQFGHVLFEMAAGFTVEMAIPDFKPKCSANVANVGFQQKKTKPPRKALKKKVKKQKRVIYYNSFSTLFLVKLQSQIDPHPMTLMHQRTALFLQLKSLFSIPSSLTHLPE